MSIRNLRPLFAPRSVAVVGASNRPHSIGAVVTRNLLAGGFAGPILPVHPKHAAVAGVLAYPSVAALPLAPDLAVLATPPATIPRLISELAERGTRAAVVLTAGLKPAHGAEGEDLELAALEAARPHGLRMLGPNCVGLIVPGIALNASFAHVPASPGSIAFVSQSGALCTAVLDWASSHGVGFSHFVSLGNSADVDVSDVLDYLSADPETQSILLYLEGLDEARKFMSAARAAARTKPVLVIKSGRRQEGARAAASHTGALAGADEVFDAAFRRAGMLRVERIDQLFDAAESLARLPSVSGERLLIMSNGGGPGVMATDALIEGGGTLAELSPRVFGRLDDLLPQTWSHANPIDLVGDATRERYGTALRALLEEPNADGVLVIHAPTAVASGRDAARAVAEVIVETKPRVPVLTCWLGADGAEPARRILRDAEVASYDTPEDAVRAFLEMAAYRRNQELLREIPRSLATTRPPDRDGAQRAIHEALESRREWLSDDQTRRVLECYGIPVVPSALATDAESAGACAESLGFPVALKIQSPDITHKSDVGGVVLDLETPGTVREAAEAMARRVARDLPHATLAGFLVQRMERRPKAHELIVGAMTDPLFGPVLLFGQGGTAVEVVGDKAIGLLPVNASLAAQLVQETRVARLLAGYRNEPAVDLESLYRVLTQVSQLVIELPQIVELDLNPLLADADGVVALDARIRVLRSGKRVPLAIHPYPSELEEELTLPDHSSVIARPIRPEDEPAHRAFFESLDREDVYFRFFNTVREIPHSHLARYTQIDYDREMAFIAHRPDAPHQTLGVVRAVIQPGDETAEFAVIVRSDVKGHGLGRALLRKMIRYARARRLRALYGQVLSGNRAMLALAKELGFERIEQPDPQIVDVRLDLHPVAPERSGSHRRH